MHCLIATLIGWHLRDGSEEPETNQGKLCRRRLSPSNRRKSCLIIFISLDITNFELSTTQLRPCIINTLILPKDILHDCNLDWQAFAGWKRRARDQSIEIMLAQPQPKQPKEIVPHHTHLSIDIANFELYTTQLVWTRCI